jgi:hypothetical protein
LGSSHRARWVHRAILKSLDRGCAFDTVSQQRFQALYAYAPMLSSTVVTLAFRQP